MQFPTRHIHVLRSLGAIQVFELAGDLCCLMWLDAGLGTGREKGFNSSMTEGLYHVCSVA